MHRYESECYSKRLICYFQSLGLCKSSYDQNMTISSVSFDLLILLLPNLVWWYIIISQSVLCRNWNVLFKVKITAKSQNVNECLSIWYFLNCWTFYHQTWYGDATLWARLSFKKIDLLSPKSRSQLRIIWSKCDFLTYYLNCWSFCN